MTPDAQHDFQAHVASHGVDLSPRSIETLQINLTKRCNQACRHCHVDASPARTESLAETGIDTVLALLDRHPAFARSISLAAHRSCIRDSATWSGPPSGVVGM